MTIRSDSTWQVHGCISLDISAPVNARIFESADCRAVVCAGVGGKEGGAEGLGSGHRIGWLHWPLAVRASTIGSGAIFPLRPAPGLGKTGGGGQKWPGFSSVSSRLESEHERAIALRGQLLDAQLLLDLILILAVCPIGSHWIRGGIPCEAECPACQVFVAPQPRKRKEHEMRGQKKKEEWEKKGLKVGETGCQGKYRKQNQDIFLRRNLAEQQQNRKRLDLLPVSFE